MIEQDRMINIHDQGYIYALKPGRKKRLDAAHAKISDQALAFEVDDSLLLSSFDIGDIIKKDLFMGILLQGVKKVFACQVYP